MTKNALPEKVPKSLGRAPPPRRMQFFRSRECPLFMSTLSAAQYLGLALHLREWYLGVRQGFDRLFFFKSIALWYQHEGWCPGVRQGLKDINLKSLIIIQYKLQVGKDGEASTDPDDWGECHSDCPLRGYRDNQVKISNFLPTDNVISICFDHMIT